MQESSADAPERSVVRPWLRGLGAALAVGLCGSFATLDVWVLALVSAFAFSDLGRRERHEGHPDGPDRVGWLMQLAFLVVLCAAAFDNRDASVARRFGVTDVAGLALLAGGLELRRRTERAMGRFFTVQLRVDPDHKVIDGGPFRMIRHPSYASLGAIALGTALSVRSPLAAIATLVVWLPVILLRIRQEEAELGRRLGAAYRDYAGRTWRLVPGVY
jgi:protein-S-isoprenylcysteine O-methyltransferase Ste14